MYLFIVVLGMLIGLSIVFGIGYYLSLNFLNYMLFSLILIVLVYSLCKVYIYILIYICFDE